MMMMSVNGAHARVPVSMGQNASLFVVVTAAVESKSK